MMAVLPVRSLLSSLGVFPGKRLGQNFLTDRRTASKIIRHACLGRDDTVLEVGPGTGALTGLLCAAAHKVTAVEVDRRLAAFLKEEFARNEGMEIVNADILSLDISRYARNAPERRLKVIGAIPYSITSPLITRLIEQKKHISLAVLVVQEEVADRICAMPGGRTYGAFTCFVQFHCSCFRGEKVPRNSFYPVPRVDSRIVVLQMREKPPVAVADEGLFFALIRAGFMWRRKTLLKCLLSGIKPALQRDQLELAFVKAGIPLRARAEELSLHDFAKIGTATVFHKTC